MAQRVNVAQLYRATGFEKKKASRKESEREEGEKIIVKNAGKQNQTELEWTDKGNAKEKYKGKENGSKIMTWWQKVLC